MDYAKLANQYKQMEKARTAPKSPVMPYTPDEPNAAAGEGLGMRVLKAPMRALTGAAKGVASNPYESARLGSWLGEALNEVRIGQIINPALKVGPTIGDITHGVLRSGLKAAGVDQSGLERISEAARATQGSLRAGAQTPQILTPQSSEERFGYGVEKIAEVVAPGVAASKVGGVVSAGEGLGGIMTKLGTRAALDTAGTLAVSAKQQGEVTPEIVQSSVMSGAFSAAGKYPQMAFGAGMTAKGGLEYAQGDKKQGLIDMGFGVLGIIGSRGARGQWLDIENPQAIRAQAVKAYEKALATKGEDKKILQAQLRHAPKTSPYETAADHRVILDWDQSTGKFDTAKAAEDVQQKIEKWDEFLDVVLENNTQPRHNLDDFAEQAIKSVGSLNESASEKKAIRSKILSYVEDEKAAAGTAIVTDKELNRIKRGLYKEGYSQGRKLESGSAIAANSLAKSMKTAIEEKSGISQVADVNKIIGELIDLRRVLENTHGRVVRGGKLGKWMQQGIGAIIGSTHGPLGSLVGASIADQLHMRSIDPYIATVAAQKKLNLAGIIPEWKNIQNRAIDDLIKSKFKSPPPLLPEGSNQINVPEGGFSRPAPAAPQPSRVLSQDEAVSKLREMGYSGPLTIEEIKNAGYDVSKEKLKAWMQKNPTVMQEFADVGVASVSGGGIMTKAAGNPPEFKMPPQSKSPKVSKPTKTGITNYRSAHQIDVNDSRASHEIDVASVKEKIKELNGYISNRTQADIKKLEKMQGNPEMDVKIYRAAPKNELNSGDWVTTNREYANNIKQQNGGKVFTYTVKAKDLRYPNDIANLPSLARAAAFSYLPAP